MHQQAEAALGHLVLVAELTLRAAEAAVVFLDILHLKLVRRHHQLVEAALGLQIQKSAQETAHAQFQATTQRRNVKAQDQDKATTLLSLEEHQIHLQFGHQVAETTAIAQTLRTQLLHSVVLAAELGHLTLADIAISQDTIQRMHVSGLAAHLVALGHLTLLDIVQLLDIRPLQLVRALLLLAAVESGSVLLTLEPALLETVTYLQVQKRETVLGVTNLSANMSGRLDQMESAQLKGSSIRRTVKAQDQDKEMTLINLEEHLFHLQCGILDHLELVALLDISTLRIVQVLDRDKEMTLINLEEHQFHLQLGHLEILQVLDLAVAALGSLSSGRTGTS
jgi:hypothetical protein